MTEREYLIDEICHIIEDTPKDELAVGKIADYILKERQRIIQNLTILNKDKLKDLNTSGLVVELWGAIQSTIKSDISAYENYKSC